MNSIRPGDWVRVIKDSHSYGVDNLGLGVKSDLPIGNIYNVSGVSADGTFIRLKGLKLERLAIRFSVISNVEVLLHMGKTKCIHISK